MTYRIDVGNDANISRSRDLCRDILCFSWQTNTESTFGAVKE